MWKQILFTLIGALNFHMLQAQTVDTTLAHQQLIKAKLFVDSLQYDSAVFYYKAAAEGFEKAEAWERFLYCRNYAGHNLRKVGKYDEALPVLQEALESGILHFDTLHQEVARSYHFIGMIASTRGDYDKALAYYHKSSKISLKLFGEQSSLVVRNYNNIGLVYHYKGNYDKALEYHHRASKISLKLFGEQNLYIATSYNNLGLIYGKKGNNDKALEHYHKALKIMLILLGEQYSPVATIYNNIGIAYNNNSNYERALDYHQKALNIRLKLFEEQHLDVADSYNSIGNVYSDKGNYEKALEYHQKSLNIELKFLREEHPDVAASYNNIGNVHYHKGNYDRALEYHQKSLDIRLKLFGEQYSGVAVSYNNIGNVYDGKGNYNRALEYHKKALNIKLKFFGEQHPSVVTSYNNIGSVYDDIGNYEKALEYFQNAISANIPDFKSNSVNENPDLNVDFEILDKLELLESLQFKANAFIHKSRSAEDKLQSLNLAIETNILASTLLDTIRQSYAIENSRLDLGEKSEKLYTEAIPACLDAFEKTKEKKYLSLAFKFAEKGKAIVLSDALQESTARQISGIPDSLLEKERDLKVDQYFYQQQVVETRKDSAQLAMNQDYLFKANREWEALILQLEKDHPEYYKLKYKANVATIDSIQHKLLDQQSALVEYTVTDSTMWVFTVTKDSAFYQSIALPKNFKANMHAFIAEINDIPDTTFTGIFKNYTTAAHQYYQLLLQPVLSKLDTEITQLHIIADGVLNYLPFEVLLTEEVDTTGILGRQVNYRFAQLPYLARQYTVNYNYSSTLALQMGKTEKKQTEKVQVLAFAPFAKETKEGELASICKRNNQEPLPGTWDEIRALANYFDGHFYAKEKATESVFKKQCSAGNYDILYLGSHGEALFEKDSTNTNALIHFNTESKDTLEDNRLHSHEIYNLAIDAQLVILSACETGRGKHQKGEGLMSLSRAFSYAGCPALVMTLWEVDDASSADLMAFFYKGLAEGLTKEIALQRAKLKYLEEEYNNASMKTGRLTAHPYYWGAYVGLGNSVNFQSRSDAQ